jgi:glutamate synthase domain-containing protein 2
VATQKPELRRRLDVEAGAKRLATFFDASVRLMQVMARACGHDALAGFRKSDLTTWKRDIAHLSGVTFGGVPENR